MFVRLFIIASHIPVFLCTVYSAAVFKKLEEPLRSFCYFVFISGLIQLLSLLLWIRHRNNMPLLHIYVPLGFVCLTQFYSRILKNFISEKLLWGVLLAFVALSLLNSCLFQPLYTCNSYALVLESTLVIIYSFSTFIFMLNSIFKERKASLFTSLNFINSGLFVYYVSSLLVFYCGTVLAVYSSSALIKSAWLFHAFFSVTMYVFFIVGLAKRPRNHE